MTASLKIGTRGSKLALWQANWVRTQLEKAHPDIAVELVIIKTKGDKIQDVPLAKVGGKGLFVKEIEEALLDGRIDLAVHSMKDMPGDIPPGLCIGPVPERGLPLDVLISGNGQKLTDLEEGASVGTSSLRRAAQLLHLRPGIRIIPLRGNLDTRLRKLDEGQMDAIVLAAAGVHRLGLENRVTEYLDPAHMLPAVAQGALCIEIRASDPETDTLVGVLNHPETRTVVLGERAFLHRLEGSCQIPVAGYGNLENGRFTLTGLVANLDGTVVLQESAAGQADQAREIGIELAEKLLARGADRILQELTAMNGKVYLVGAGPGDPGLLTIKGLECIRKADVLVYDYLASPTLLKYAEPDAEKIYVGKKGGDHTLSQDGINDLIAQKALEGHTVTRLKGGDPFIFGRGGEEAEVLIAKGIPFEVVPGVTSAIAAPAYAGIPLTHRKFTSNLAFVTGHEDPTKDQSSIDWEALARGIGTLVFLMGVKNLPHIVQKLCAHGRSPDTPVALIRWGTTLRQTTVTGTLDTIVAAVEKAGLKAPAVIVVGEVVSLRQTMQWFENRPLMGKKIVVTRAREQASKLVNTLMELGAQCLEYPTIEVVPPDDWQPLDAAIENLQSYDWLVFTSVNGVKYFFKRLFEKGLDVRALGALKTAVIGPVTKARLAEFGITADILPESYRAESVVDAFSSQALQGKKVLLPRAREARAILPVELEKMGAAVDEITTYITRPVSSGADELVSSLRAGEVDLITFTSSSTVTNFKALLPASGWNDLLANVRIASIGPITTETAQSLGFEVDITAETYTIPGLCTAIVNACR